MKPLNRAQIALVVFELVTLPLAIVQVGFELLGFAACLVSDAVFGVLGLAARLLSIPVTWYALGLWACSW